MRFPSGIITVSLPRVLRYFRRSALFIWLSHRFLPKIGSHFLVRCTRGSACGVYINSRYAPFPARFAC